MKKIEIIFLFTNSSNSTRRIKMETPKINPAFIALVEKKLDIECCNNRFYLPINTIADLKVTIYILRWRRHDKTFAYDFAVKLDNVCMSDLDRSPYHLYGSSSKETVKLVLEDFMDFTDKVVIDKMTGMLVLNNDAEKEGELMKEFCDLFSKKNMKVSVNECCVCYAPTTSTTSCDHSLCVSCINAIKTDDNDDEDYPFKQCPMCRQNIEYYN